MPGEGKAGRDHHPENHKSREESHLEQLFTIDKERINNFMGLTSDWEMAQIEKALKCSLALDQENLVKNDSKTA